MKRSMIPKFSSSLLAVSFFFACTSQEPMPSSAVPVSTPAVAGKPVPVASLTQENGNTVEFYDFPYGILVSESGKAGAASPTLKEEVRTPDQLVDVWKSLAPASEVPRSIRELQARQMRIKDKIPTFPEQDPAILQSGAPPAPAAPLRKQAACTNGCCEMNWINSQTACFQPYEYFSWVLPNYGVSEINLNSLFYVNTLVCSASGTSTFKISAGEGGGIWPVYEGHYRTFKWIRYDYPFQVTSTVNSPADPHQHTYCGHSRPWSAR